MPGISRPLLAKRFERLGVRMGVDAVRVEPAAGSFGQLSVALMPESGDGFEKSGIALQSACVFRRATSHGACQARMEGLRRALSQRECALNGRLEA